ncbi:MAG: hypothetical protein ACRD1R_01215, partial [Acidobacteriota bacterium]
MIGGVLGAFLHYLAPFRGTLCRIFFQTRYEGHDLQDIVLRDAVAEGLHGSAGTPIDRFKK